MMRILASIVMLVAIGCVKRDPPKFCKGEVVELVITGEKAQVCTIRRFTPYRYYCRVYGTRERAVHGLISQRTETDVYPLVLFREFELQKVGPWSKGAR